MVTIKTEKIEILSNFLLSLISLGIIKAWSNPNVTKTEKTETIDITTLNSPNSSGE